MSQFNRSKSDLKLSLLTSASNISENIYKNQSTYHQQRYIQPRVCTSQQAKNRFSQSIGVENPHTNFSTVKSRYLTQKLTIPQDQPFLDISSSFKATQSNSSAFLSKTVRYDPIKFGPGPGDYDVSVKHVPKIQFSTSKRFFSADDFAKKQLQMTRNQMKIDKPLGPQSYNVTMVQSRLPQKLSQGDRFKENFEQKYKMEIGPGWHEIGRKEEMRGGLFSETGHYQ